MTDLTSLTAALTTSGLAVGLAATVGRASAKALSKLILGLGEIPEAWIAGKTQAIRDQTAGVTAYNKALNDQGIALALEDPERARRAMLRLLSTEDRKQCNREAVASLAFDDLKEAPSVSEEDVSEEFLDRFDAMAASASSSEMRELYARILAGECRKPGSFSLATLHVFSVMDQELAKTIDQFSGLVSGVSTAYSILAGGPFNVGRKLLALKAIEGFGMVAHGVTIKAKAGASEHHFFFENVCLRIEKDVETEVTFEVSFLTPLGEQVFTLVRKPTSEAEVDSLADHLMSLRGVKGVSRISLVRDDTSMSYSGAWSKIRGSINEAPTV